MSLRDRIRALLGSLVVAASFATGSAFVAAAAAQAPSPPPAPTPPQAVIKVSDDVFFRFGVLMQAWARFEEIPGVGTAADDYRQEFFLRRMRVLFGGQLAKNATFFFEIDGPNIGRAVAATGAATGTKANDAIRVQDAVLSYKYNANHFIDGGIILTPLCYNCAASATALLPLDYSTYSFLNNGPLDLNVGRDYGFQARGYVAGDRVEYRAAIFSGLRNAARTNPLRGMARVMVSLLEKNNRGFYYPGVIIAPGRRALNIGAAADVQSDYNAFSGDAFYSIPIGSAAQLTGNGQVIYYDGAGFLPSLPEQTTYYLESGLYLAKPKLLPFGSIGFRRFDDDAQIDSNEYQLGFTYYFRGSNANFRAAWISTDPRVDGAPSASSFTGQLQFFFY